MVNINFEHDFQKKIMIQTFEPGSTLVSKADVLKWRSLWMGELKSWHSPYKVIVDLSAAELNPSEEVKAQISLMIKFFEGLFLKSIVLFSQKDGHLSGLEKMSLVIRGSFDEAQIAAGVRGLNAPRSGAGDFRSSIQFQNHFPQHVIEMSFIDPVTLASEEQISVLKSKLTNNLMQWHSKWNLLIDCTNLLVEPKIHEEWRRLERYFGSFFMKAVVGYQPHSDTTADQYPFKVYRSRHKAVALLEDEGHFMGNEANCKSRQEK